MRQSILSKPKLAKIFALLLPVGLWGMVWLSISPGEPKAILNPGNPVDFAQGLRSAFPLLAAGAAAIAMGLKVVQRRPPTFGFLSPLGLITGYGFVGLAASLKSPDGSLALWWAALYLSVPIVLWGVVWGTDSLDQLRRLVNATWLVLILATAALFIVAVLYLDLVHQILNPSQFLQCQTESWFDLTNARIRGTGVGRYAAIAGIIAAAGLWQVRWRPMWLVVLLASMTLLLYTGARGAFAGFAAGAALVVFFHLRYSGKKALLAGLLITVALGSVLWNTGGSRTFLDNCIFTGARTAATVNPAPSIDVTGSSGTTDTSQAAVSPSNSEASALNPVIPESPVEQVKPPLITKEFFRFTGRTAVWVEGWRFIKTSPLIGFGFHADRLLLKTHMHNSVMHSLIQAGFLGAIPFVAAVIFGWVLFLRSVLKPGRLPGNHRHLVIQCGGVLAFLTMRSLPESTGAFFGVDWFILAVVLFYLQVVNDGRQQLDISGERRIIERA